MQSVHTPGCLRPGASVFAPAFSRVRGEKKKTFSYRDIKDVYTIVLFEKSPKALHAYPEQYRHYFEQKSDTGLRMDFLQKYLFIPLDIFRKSKQNGSIRGKREAWLALFSCDKPETIIELIEKYPEFRGIYEEAYEICRNTERVMDMLFSKELYELDRNTVQYMIDEMQDTIDAQQSMIDTQQSTIDAQQEKLEKAQEERKRMQQTFEQTLEQTLERTLEQTLRGTVDILRKLHIPETEIILQLSNQYRMTEEQVRQYLGNA